MALLEEEEEEYEAVFRLGSGISRALVGHYVARCGNQKVDRSELKMQRLAWSKVNTCRKFSRDEIHKAI